MRDIKFRVWDDHYRYMNYKVLVGIYGEWEQVKDDKNYTACCMWIEPDKVDYKCEPHWTHFEPYHKDIHLMQYTGLKDKKGVEIYEGDIIKVHYSYEGYNSETLGAYEVEDEIQGIVELETALGLYVDTGNDRQNYLYEYLSNLSLPEYYEQIEVIGNIYENKELLDK